MTIYNTADNVNDFKKKGTNNDDFYYIDNEKVQIIEVCRLGFNPTKKYVGWVLTQQKRMKNIKQN